MTEPDTKTQCDVKTFYTQSVPTDMVSTTTHTRCLLKVEEGKSARTKRLI